MTPAKTGKNCKTPNWGDWYAAKPQNGETDMLQNQKTVASIVGNISTTKKMRRSSVTTDSAEKASRSKGIYQVEEPRIGTFCPNFSTSVLSVVSTKQQWCFKLHQKQHLYSCVVSTNQQWCFIPHQKQHVSFCFNSVVSSNVFNRNNVFFHCFHVAGLTVGCIYSSCCCFGLWVVCVFVSLSLSWFNCHPLHITHFPDGLLVKTSPITHYTFSRWSLGENVTHYTLHIFQVLSYSKWSPITHFPDALLLKIVTHYTFYIFQVCQTCLK